MPCCSRHPAVLASSEPCASCRNEALDLQEMTGCPISRSFFARCGIPRRFHSDFRFIRYASRSTSVVSHISRKTSEIWGTHRSVVKTELPASCRCGSRLNANASTRVIACKITPNARILCAGSGGSLLYWLLYQKLFPYFRPFRIFPYLTFRTAFASLTAMLIALLIGPFVIEKLREFQISQYIREDGPQGHQKKAGTPTMGGVLICIAILLPTLLWSDLSNPFVWLVMLSTLAFGAIGFADDYIKVVQRRNLGLTPTQKMGLQVLTSIAFALVLLAMQTQGIYSTQLSVPFIKSFHPHLAVGFLTRIPHLSLIAF